MTIVLVGVGVDSENMSPLPQMLYEDGTFDYIPMPEKSKHPSDTLETKSVGDFVDRDKHSLNYIYHRRWSDKITEPDAIYDHPVHHDPNFETLTYGDGSRSTSWTENLNPEEDDVIAFYTGLPHPDDGKLDRYIIGYMMVADITFISETMSKRERENIIAKHPENAHYKRFQGNGELYAFDEKAGPSSKEEIVIVDGEEPGGLLKEAYQITQREKIETDSGGQIKHKLKPEFLSEFNVTNKDDESRTIDRKPFLNLELDGHEFVERITPS